MLMYLLLNAKCMADSIGGGYWKHYWGRKFYLKCFVYFNVVHLLKAMLVEYRMHGFVLVMRYVSDTYIHIKYQV